MRGRGAEIPAAYVQYNPSPLVRNIQRGDKLFHFQHQFLGCNLDTTGEFTATGIGSDDNDSLLERGEVFEIVIPGLNSGGANPLTTELGTDQTFTLEVIPPKGAVLFIQRTTPVSLESRTSLD